MACLSFSGTDDVRALLSSGCPQAKWADALAEQPFALAGGSTRVLLNIGANKGFAIAAFIESWTQRNTSPQHWHREILGFARSARAGRLRTLKYLNCGVCSACTNRPVRRHRRDEPVIVHALELLSQNRRLVRYVANATGVADVVHVHELAASNVSGAFFFNASTVGGGVTFGRESTSLCTTARCGADASAKTVSEASGTVASTEAAARGQGKDELVRVEAVSVDDFLERQGLKHVSLVSIDVEGWDALVIEGMRRSLTNRAIDVFEFEKVRKAYWSHVDPAERRTLRTLLGWLLPLGYECFWQADRYLVPASGACWNDAFEDVGWSNLVCAHQPQVLRFFGEQFNTTREQLVEHWQKLAAAKIKAPAHSRLRASIAKSVVTLQSGA